MCQTIFYGSDCDELAFFVEDAGEWRSDFAGMNGVPVPHFYFIGTGNFDPGHRRQKTTHGDQIRPGRAIQRDRVLNVKLTRARPPESREMRAASETAAQIMRETADVGSGGTDQTKCPPWW